MTGGASKYVDKPSADGLARRINLGIVYAIVVPHVFEQVGNENFVGHTSSTVRRSFPASIIVDLETIGKHGNRIIINTGFGKSRQCCLVVHVLAIAMERQNQGRSGIFGIVCGKPNGEVSVVERSVLFQCDQEKDNYYLVTPLLVKLKCLRAPVPVCV